MTGGRHSAGEMRTDEPGGLHELTGASANAGGLRGRVAVVGGGTSSEHDVSRDSARAVGEALAEAGYAVVEMGIGRDGRWEHLGRTLGGDRACSLHAALGVLRTVDAIFPALHGPDGEDGTAAALAELAGIPCVGSPMAAGAIAMDKWVTKLVAREVGVEVAAGTLIGPGDPPPPWRGECVVKPVAAGSSHGVSLVEAEADLPAAIAAARAEDSRVLVEERLRGREVDIAVLELPDGSLRTGPPLEIVTGDALFTTEAKYAHPEFRVPAALAPQELAALQAAALATFRAIGCRGIARVDFFLVDGVPVLNEVNTMPGMTALSQVPLMFAAEGLAYPELVAIMVEEARSRAGRGSGAARVATGAEVGSLAP
ncbi:MAG: ATP-grasp domain-containing protein [bacterium]|nr:ATP-grasp domain-containing protein [bacterium]